MFNFVHTVVVEWSQFDKITNETDYVHVQLVK